MKLTIYILKNLHTYILNFLNIKFFQIFQKSQSHSRGGGLEKKPNRRGNLREITITLTK
jgi:hypothetical protein